jgi:hypothetical protein
VLVPRLRLPSRAADSTPPHEVLGERRAVHVEFSRRPLGLDPHGIDQPHVPPKDLLKDDTPDPVPPYHTRQGDYEDKIVSHVICEIANGLAEAQKSFALPSLTVIAANHPKADLVIAPSSGVELGADMPDTHQAPNRVFPKHCSLYLVRCELLGG